MLASFTATSIIFVVRMTEHVLHSYVAIGLVGLMIGRLAGSREKYEQFQNFDRIKHFSIVILSKEE